MAAILDAIWNFGENTLGIYGDFDYSSLTHLPGPFLKESTLLLTDFPFLTNALGLTIQIYKSQHDIVDKDLKFF